MIYKLIIKKYLYWAYNTDYMELPCCLVLALGHLGCGELKCNTFTVTVASFFSFTKMINTTMFYKRKTQNLSLGENLYFKSKGSLFRFIRLESINQFFKFIEVLKWFYLTLNL